MIQDKLIEKFGGVINHMSCIYINEGEKHLRNLVKDLPGKICCLEIGTYQAVSTIILAEYFDKVVTVDIKKQKLTDEIIDFSGLKHKILACTVGDRKSEIALVDNICEQNNISLCFIDGHHEDGELARDWDMLKDKCDTILIHDYDPHFPEVFKFVNEIKGWDKKVSSSFVLLTKETTTKKPTKRVKKIGTRKR